MRQLTKEEIFAADDLISEVVPVPEWGPDGAVTVRAFDLASRDAFYAPLIGKEGEERRAAIAEVGGVRLIVFSVVDADGNQLFTEGDAERLKKKLPAVLERIVAVAQRLNGLGGEAKDTAKKPSADPEA